MADLIIIIILHVISLHDLVRLVALGHLLFWDRVLDVCVLYYYLLTFLFDNLLLGFTLHLGLLWQSLVAGVALLLLGDLLFLFRWALIAFLVAVLVIEEAFESLH